MLKGVSIQIMTRTRIGTDEFNRPVYAETPETVENVLVGQPAAKEITDTLNLTGKKAVYKLGIPKGDVHEWEDASVVLPEPFSGVYRTIGYPVAGIEANIPLSWNKQILVERYG